MIQLPQKLIFLAGETRSVKLRCDARHLAVTECPPSINLVNAPACTPDGWVLEFCAGKRQAETYETLRLRILTTTGEFHAAIPCRVLTRNEVFFCVVTTCNTHWGYDPSRMYLCDVNPFKDWSKCSGDPLLFHGHSYPSSRFMAEAAHAYNLPMTWLIDHTVAKHHGSELVSFHNQFGDDVGVLPSSYFFHNAVNYNLDRSIEETTAVMEGTISGIQSGLSGGSWVPEIRVGGIDQWVGGLGSKWLEAARACGLRGLWGTAFDHVTCDTSIYHEGLPWDVYRMSRENFRYPSTKASDPWGFPWTTRDLVNSFYEYPGSSVHYSTDPDDIRHCGIMDNQHDYWDNLLAGLLNNSKHNNASCFVLHNEDHDAHRAWSQRYLLQFFSRLPSSIVRATLDEVTQWLDLCYAEGEHPRQALELEDPLRCHDAVRSARAPQGFVPHAKWKIKNGVNPNVIAFYDNNSRWMASEGSYIPEQLIDYKDRNEFQETGVSPKIKLPVITKWKETATNDVATPEVTVEFESDRAMCHFPLILWNGTAPKGALRLKDASIIWVDIQEGKNTFKWSAEP